MAKFLLRFSASQPVEMHVHGIGPPWVDGISYKSKGCGVDGFHWRRWIRMFHSNERVTGGDGSGAIDIKSAKLDLGGG